MSVKDAKTYVMRSAPTPAWEPQIGWKYKIIRVKTNGEVVILATHLADGTPTNQVHLELTMMISDFVHHFDVVEKRESRDHAQELGCPRGCVSREECDEPRECSLDDDGERHGAGVCIRGTCIEPCGDNGGCKR